MERLKLKYYFAIYSAMSPASPELTTFAYTIDPGTFAVFIRQLTYHAFGDAVIGESDNYSPGEFIAQVQQKYPGVPMDPVFSKLLLLKPAIGTEYAVTQYELDQFDIELSTRIICMDMRRTTVWFQEVVKRFKIVKFNKFQREKFVQFLQLIMFYTYTMEALTEYQVATIEDIPFFDNFTPLIRGDKSVSSSMPDIRSKDLYDLLELDQLWYLFEVDGLYKGKIIK